MGFMGLSLDVLLQLGRCIAEAGFIDVASYPGSLLPCLLEKGRWIC